MITAKDIMRERGITEKDMAKAREDTQAYIEAYNLRSARKQQHMTQTQVADAMGVSQNRVSQIETGDVDAMTVSSIRRYAEALGGKLKVTLQLANGCEMLL